MPDDALCAPTCFRALSLDSGVIRLDADDVHLWHADLNLGVRELAALWNDLSKDEQARARRPRFQKDRNEFVATHGILRRTLASYLDIEPAQLKFSYNAYGKPELAGKLDAQDLRFNLSHSHGLCLYAIARGRDVGVDVEYVRPDWAKTSIAETFFSPAEIAAICALAPDMQPEAFFSHWTWKEAYLKALGRGFSDGWHVSAETSPAPAGWVFWRLVPGPEHVGTLAAKGKSLRLTCWQWPNEGVFLD